MKPGRIDLHVHTAASDGTHSPRGAVQEALDRGVTLLAITDHDTTQAIPEALTAARDLGVLLIPGIELSADSEDHDLHLLGYFIRHDDPRLQQALRGLLATRNSRNHLILERLKSLGAPVAPERVRQIAGSGSVGRPHIAAALVEAGHVASQTEAFGRYLARGRAAFVPRQRLLVSQACGILKAAGGLAILAHAAKIGSRALLDQALDAGLDGIEVFHTDHSANDVERLLALARERSLLVTGGTDSHGPRSDRPLAIGSVAIPDWVGEALLARAPAQ